MNFLFDVVFFIQSNAEIIRPIMVNIIIFIAFLILLNIISRKPKLQIEAIERNTEYVKQDFRILKQEFKIMQEHIKTINNTVDVSGVVYKMIYETPNTIKNEFITIKRNSIQLSTLGFVVNTEIGISQMIKKNWDTIFPYLKDNKESYSSHPYDMQIYCLYIGSCLEQFFTAEEISKIKHYAYEEGHNISSYFAIIGLGIRDVFFEQEKIIIPKFPRNKLNKIV